MLQLLLDSVMYQQPVEENLTVIFNKTFFDYNLFCYEVLTLSAGSWIHTMSAGGFPSTSQDSETIVSKSASTDFGRVRKIGPSIEWKIIY